MKEVAYQPAGYQNVIPYLHVDGATRVIAFMKDVFGAEEIAIYSRPDGTVGHAAFRIGDSVIELADSWRGMACHALCSPDICFQTRKLPIIAHSKPEPWQ